MRVVFTSCAGLDVHKKTVVACRRKRHATGKVHWDVRTFGTTTPALLQLVDWLREWECSHVALESTGEYWKPVFNVLEGTCEVWLVNAQHVKHVPGRKTDVKDAEWLAELLQHGLLPPSFIPPAPQRDLRDLTRHRTTLVRERARVVNRVQKVLEGANIKLSSVASDVLGVSGRAMLAALVAGQTDAEQMAALARGRLRPKRAALEQALTGIIRPHHRFLLAQHLSHLDFITTQMEAVSQAITQQIASMNALPRSPSSPREPVPGTPIATPQPLLPSQAIPLLDTIPGVDTRTAEVIVAELGTDMGQFPSAAHAAAWAGVAPGNHESAGKRASGKTRKGNRALRTVLTQAAWAASRTKDTYLAALYHQVARRRGRKRAIVAVAHSIIVSAYHMLKRHQTYYEQGQTYFDDHKKVSVVNRLVARLGRLGYNARLEPVAVST